MLNPERLKCAKEDIKHYPNTDYVKCDMLDEDNAVYEAELPKGEVELALYLKTSVLPLLIPNSRKKLLKLIEEYGDERAEEADFNANYEG